jgi:hypothetical protein
MSLPAALSWIKDHAASNSEYTIIIENNESLDPLNFSLKNKKNVTITIKSSNDNKIITLNSLGSLLTIESGITFILEDNIEMRGRNDNNASLITINSGGTLIINGGIVGNNNGGKGYYNSYSGLYYEGGAGIFVSDGGKLIMQSGYVINNITPSGYRNNGGGVFIAGNGIFEMSGGFVSDNSVDYSHGYGCGDAVCVSSNGKFVLRGGIISHNGYGTRQYIPRGCVFVDEGGNFTMTGGEISGNDNRGVYSIGYFNKTGGIIYGANANADKKNRDYAVYVSDGKKRTGTANESNNIDTSLNGQSGGWD